MNLYSVEVEATVRGTVEVVADNEAEALTQAEGSLELDGIDYIVDSEPRKAVFLQAA